MESNDKEISHDVAVSLWKKAMLSVETECERQPEVIMVKGVCIATLGNFSASTGKAKSKKTFNLSAIVAAALCDHPVLCYTPSAASVGRPRKEPFDPYREIPAQIHLNVLGRVFAASPGYDYDGFCHALQDAYLEEGVKINYNKAVSVVTFLRNKRMVLQDDKRKYIANPEAHY